MHLPVRSPALVDRQRGLTDGSRRRGRLPHKYDSVRLPWEDRTILAPTQRLAIRAVPVALLLLVVTLIPGGLGTGSIAHATSVASPVVTPTQPPAQAPTDQNNSSGLECDGVYWASWVWANYTPSWCYGHDEATVSYVSDAAGSGEDANFSFTLPADGDVHPG